jgi:hypothetical protein
LVAVRQKKLIRGKSSVLTNIKSIHIESVNFTVTLVHQDGKAVACAAKFSLKRKFNFRFYLSPLNCPLS